MDTGGAGGMRKGFFASLADLSFRHFITGRIISILYVVSLIFVTLYAVLGAGQISILAGVFLQARFASSALGWIVGILLFLVLAPLFLLVGAIYVRVLLEIVIVLFRISENTAEMANRLRTGGLGSSADRGPD